MISVIIPVYNSINKGLEQCLDAMMKQTYSDIEVIMVDDGSTDGSGDVCNLWSEKDKRFVYIQQKNQGPAAARNTGLRSAKGSEIAFVDSDDLPDVGMLETLHNAMNDACAEMAISRYEAKIEAKIPEDLEFSVSGERMTEGLFDYHTPLFKALYAKLFKREILNNIWFADLRTGEDIDFLQQVYARVSKCSCIDKVLYHYRDWEDSIMHTLRAEDYLDMLQCYENMVQRLSSGNIKLYNRALDAMVRKIVSSRYRNRKLKDETLAKRVDELQNNYLPLYRTCDNGNRLAKYVILASVRMPWLHAMIMDCRER